MVTNLPASANGMRSTTSMSPASTSEEIPVVFVVDDDISVRESLELLISSAGWQPELFETAEQFLSRPRSTVANCLVLDVNLPDLERARPAVDGRDRARRYADHFRHRLWRRAAHRQGDEGRRRQNS